MNDIVSHIDEITERIAKLDAAAGIKFAAWCMLALVRDAAIARNLIALTGAKADHQMIEAIVHGAWYNAEVVNVDTSLEFLQSLDWDDDAPLADADETQGCIELIGGVESLVRGVETGDATWLANCAERVINWKDHAAHFPASADGQPEAQALAREFEIQRQYLGELERGEIGNRDLGKYR